MPTDPPTRRGDSGGATAFVRAQRVHPMAVEMPRLMVKLWLPHLLAVWLWAGPLASLQLSFLGCKMGNRST